MRRSVFLLLLMLFAVVGWAQESKSETKVSLLPVIVEGNVERVPDGTVILLGVREGKGEVFVDRSKDTIVGGMGVIKDSIKYTTEKMKESARNMDFLQAAQYRDEIVRLKDLLAIEFGV